MTYDYTRPKYQVSVYRIIGPLVFLGVRPLAETEKSQAAAQRDILV